MNLIALTLLFGCSPFRQVGDQDKPVLKVFLLAGQSNMEGQGVVDLDHAEHYNGGRGILTRVLEDPNIAREFGHLRGDDGNWTKRDDVFVWYQPARGPLKAGPLSIGYAGYEGLHHFGPELALGWELGEHFDEPVLLIKTAWGGKSLMNDFRPPSSGGEVGPYYHQMLTEYAAAIAGFGERFPGLAGCEAQLSGFIWFQGWNDMFTEGGLKAYSENLVNLVGDLRVHFSQPNLPFIVGETGSARGGHDLACILRSGWLCSHPLLLAQARGLTQLGARTPLVRKRRELPAHWPSTRPRDGGTHRPKRERPQGLGPSGAQGPRVREHLDGNQVYALGSTPTRGGAAVDLANVGEGLVNERVLKYEACREGGLGLNLLARQQQGGPFPQDQA